MTGEISPPLVDHHPFRQTERAPRRGLWSSLPSGHNTSRAECVGNEGCVPNDPCVRLGGVRHATHWLGRGSAVSPSPMKYARSSAFVANARDTEAGLKEIFPLVFGGSPTFQIQER